jgi:hypothetical protein
MVLYETLVNYKLSESTFPPLSISSQAKPFSNKRPLDGYSPPVPIPTSSARPKPTNAQIPVARRLQPQIGIAGENTYASAGEVVFVLKHVFPSARTRINNSALLESVVTLRQLNEQLERDQRDNPYGSLAETSFSLDGIINNIDTEDEQREFKDHTIANVAVQGPVRVNISQGQGDCSEFVPKRSFAGSILYVLLFAMQNASTTKFTHRLCCTSTESLYGVGTRRKLREFARGKVLCGVYTLGMVLDSNQCASMMTVHTNISSLHPKSLLTNPIREALGMELVPTTST